MRPPAAPPMIGPMLPLSLELVDESLPSVDKRKMVGLEVGLNVGKEEGDADGVREGPAEGVVEGENVGGNV